MRAYGPPLNKSLNVQYGSTKLGSKTCAVCYAKNMKTQNENLTVNSLEDQQAAVLDSLTAYQPTWSAQKARTERAAGLDARLNSAYEIVNGHMNDLLERYFCLTAGVELEPFRTEAEVLAGVRQEQENAAWAEYGQD